MACCRHLGAVLFGCAEDTELLPPHLRSLYGPSYSHHCVAGGWPELPHGYATDQLRPLASEIGLGRRARAEKDGCDLRALGGVIGPKNDTSDKNEAGGARGPRESREGSEFETRKDGTRTYTKSKEGKPRGVGPDWGGPGKVEGADEELRVNETGDLLHAWAAALRLVL